MRKSTHPDYHESGLDLPSLTYADKDSHKSDLLNLHMYTEIKGMYSIHQFRLGYSRLTINNVTSNFDDLVHIPIY